MISYQLSPGLVLGAAELEQTDRGLRPNRLPDPSGNGSLIHTSLPWRHTRPGCQEVMTTTARRPDLDLHTTRRA